ncbi:hypothetical protein EJ06DRAFT_24094 [Trichodelitschia bisporula]|uniref:Uncharacterized protein n=1 Tax=Trichodelitschia bisporula TaxID=703511 RepID=A0A6G1IBN2_9PEZI|nr:hypothetical protein EJ06DRAFT_24094 [Trichodelitschia bisporula]
MEMMLILTGKDGAKSHRAIAAPHSSSRSACQSALEHSNPSFSLYTRADPTRSISAFQNPRWSPSNCRSRFLAIHILRWFPAIKAQPACLGL